MPAANTITTITLTVALSLAAAVARAESVVPAAPAPSMAAVDSTYGKLPLSFEVNQGQVDPRVQFLTRGREHQLFLTPGEAVLALQTGEGKTAEIRVTFDGADPNAEVAGLEPLPGIVNYLIGGDRSKWRTNIPTYGKVRYRHVYPGIDLVYYGHEGQLEYDLIVAPGADPKQIALTFDGAEQVAIDEHGDLIVTPLRSSIGAAAGDAPLLRLHKPVVYQMSERGEKQRIDGAYVVLKSDAALSSPAQRIAFQIASYDTDKSLIIDPVLSWATYLGTGNVLVYASFGHSPGQVVKEVHAGNVIAVDTQGNVYVTGGTFAAGSGRPGTQDGFHQIFGGIDAFVTKINAAGTAIVYSTYLDSNVDDAATAIAVDAAGNAYVTGITGCGEFQRRCGPSSFPGTAGSLIQSTFAGPVDNYLYLHDCCDAFVTKLNAAGNAIVYSTYLGGDGDDFGRGIAVDAAGNAFVTGSTTTKSNFPGAARSRIQKTNANPGLTNKTTDAFVTKINAAGTAIVYSTFLGGTEPDSGNAIAVDTSGKAYVTGYTWTFGSAFPGTAVSHIQSTPGSIKDAFVTKLNAAGTAIVYSTYLGGEGGAQGDAIAVDSAGRAYVTGSAGTGFPGTANSPIQSSPGGPGGFGGAFVTALNASGKSIAYSTYLGGSGTEGNGIAVDTAGNAYVTGLTGSEDFPGMTDSPIQNSFPGQSPFGGASGYAAFVTKLNATGTAVVFSTYLSGDDYDENEGAAIAVDPAGNAYVTGYTDAPDFRGTADSLIQSTYGGSGSPFFDAFVAKITSIIAFASFAPVVKIDLRPGNDWFEMLAPFKLGAGSNGIAPLTEPVTIQIGTFSKTIPAGSFKQTNGQFTFDGVIDGVRLWAYISFVKGDNYTLWAYAKRASLTGTSNPVEVALAVGQDNGSATVNAAFGPRPK